MADIQVGHLIKLTSSPDVAYECVYVTNPRRALIKYDGGLIVAVECNLDGTWDLAAEPANAEEKTFLEQNMPARDTTEVDLVKDPPESKPS